MCGTVQQGTYRGRLGSIPNPALSGLRGSYRLCAEHDPRSRHSEQATSAGGGSFPGRERCREGGGLARRPQDPSLHERSRLPNGLESGAGRAGIGGRERPPPLPGRDGRIHAVHGLRCAPPVATAMRPVGAKTVRSGAKAGQSGAKRLSGASLYMFPLRARSASVVNLPRPDEVRAQNRRCVLEFPPRADRRLG